MYIILENTMEDKESKKHSTTIIEGYFENILVSYNNNNDVESVKIEFPDSVIKINQNCDLSIGIFTNDAGPSSQQIVPTHNPVIEYVGGTRTLYGLYNDIVKLVSSVRPYHVAKCLEK